MKNLKKLSRNELLSLKGGDGESSNCPAIAGCANGGSYINITGQQQLACCSAPPPNPAPCGPCNPTTGLEP